MHGPLVSVILPLYNGERFVAAALQSILAQDYRPLEIIVVDDGSTDDGTQIARSFEQVRYICQPHQGIAQAWNAGLSAVQGDFVAFLAQDDLWAPHKLSLQVGYLLSHPSAQCVIARGKFFADADGFIPPGFRRELLDKEHVAHCVEAMVARKSVFETTGGFDSQLMNNCDVDWFARAKDAGITMAVMPEVLLCRRIHGGNITFQSLEMGDRMLLRVLRRSVRRQRDSQASGKGQGSAGG